MIYVNGQMRWIMVRDLVWLTMSSEFDPQRVRHSSDLIADYGKLSS